MFCPEENIQTYRLCFSVKEVKHKVKYKFKSLLISKYMKGNISVEMFFAIQVTSQLSGLVQDFTSPPVRFLQSSGEFGLFLSTPLRG